ncbi:hypothetical protein, conserved [Eimeria maxima]|uniref:Uncharacterized protein n=1 Tax=Eimeria maxima TaxID=5804 RepID=U6MA25_EIMMA|nr:hypothetical protein, conserved [Eimeria maxima]CDJ59903.1 hypothetical protein, conserved [Eimeria maxima]
MKGIPALHWTTVHSPFGNRDRSGKKSFSATSRQPAPSAYYNRVSQTKFLSAGLFDPTFKKDQLESDERKRDLQRRRRLRENADSSVSLREKVSRNFLVTHAQHSQSTGDLSNVNRGEVPPPKHRWKRETSLSELLLAGPTFRETITHELEGQRPTNVRRCSFTYSPQQPPEIQNKLKIYNVDCTFREHFDGQTVLKERKKTHTLRSTKQNKLVARIQNRPAEAEGTRSKEARPAAVQVADNSPRGCVKVAPGRKRSGRAGPLKPLYVAPVGDVCIADNGANLHSLRLYPWNALQAVPDPDLVTVATLPHYDQSFGRPNTPANPPPGFHGEMGSPTLSSESIHLLNGTIDSVNELKQKVAAAVVPEAIKSALPSMLGGNTAKGQLLLEAVEDPKHQSNCTSLTVDCLEGSTDVLQVGIARSQHADNCKENMHLEQHGSLLEQRTSDFWDCLMRVQEAEYHASVTLQNIENLPYSGTLRRQSAVSEVRLGIQKVGIGGETAPYRGLFMSSPDTRRTIEPVTSADTEARQLIAERSYPTVMLSPVVEEKLLAFRESRKRAQLKDEPLLQQESLQQALIQLKEASGGRICFEYEVAGVWMLHDAIVEQLLDREVKQLVACADSATRRFVDSLLETEAIRMAGLVRP